MALLKRKRSALSDPMSVVTRFVNACNRHDAEGVASCLHPEFDSIQPMFPSRNFRGADQVRRNWQAIFDAEPGFRLTVLRSAGTEDTVWLELHGAGRDAEVAGVFVMGVQGDRLRWARIYSSLVEQIPGIGDDATRAPLQEVPPLEESAGGTVGEAGPAAEGDGVLEESLIAPVVDIDGGGRSRRRRSRRRGRGETVGAEGAGLGAQADAEEVEASGAGDDVVWAPDAGVGEEPVTVVVDETPGEESVSVVVENQGGGDDAVTIAVVDPADDEAPVAMVIDDPSGDVGPVTVVIDNPPPGEEAVAVTAAVEPADGGEPVTVTVVVEPGEPAPDEAPVASEEPVALDDPAADEEPVALDEPVPSPEEAEPEAAREPAEPAPELQALVPDGDGEPAKVVIEPAPDLTVSDLFERRESPEPEVVAEPAVAPAPPPQPSKRRWKRR